MRQNNDSWGYLRDELEWGIAAYIENTASATTAIQDALVTRLAELVSPHCGYRSERPGSRRGKSIRALSALVSCDPLSDPGGTGRRGIAHRFRYALAVPKLVGEGEGEGCYISQQVRRWVHEESREIA
jgi:hypothetical protein